MPRRAALSSAQGWPPLGLYVGRTGKQVYREKLGGTNGYTASPVAADGRIYCVGETDGVRVVKAFTTEASRNGSTSMSSKRVMPPTASFVCSVLKTR